jgi:hypothetical protein
MKVAMMEITGDITVMVIVLPVVVVATVDHMVEGMTAEVEVGDIPVALERMNSVSMETKDLILVWSRNFFTPMRFNPLESILTE